MMISGLLAILVFFAVVWHARPVWYAVLEENTPGW